MFVFNATFLVTPGQEKKATKVLLEHVEEAKKEPGVLVTRVYRSRTDPRRFFLSHEMNDQVAFDQHRASLPSGGPILTSLYGILEPESLLMDTYEQLTPKMSTGLETSSMEESEP